ncbi:MAG: hypothetical protein U0531_18610 [Dehalococcoidia bacterium]
MFIELASESRALRALRAIGRPDRHGTAGRHRNDKNRVASRMVVPGFHPPFKRGERTIGLNAEPGCLIAVALLFSP